MAKVVESSVQSRTISVANPVWLTALIGFVMGLLFWLLTMYIGRFTGSTTIPGDVATILVATVATVVMVRLNMIRPLLVTLAVAISLWGLAGWIRGMVWFEAIGWSIGLYLLGYVLFSWLVRYAKVVPVVVAVVTVVLTVRLSLFL